MRFWNACLRIIRRTRWGMVWSLAMFALFFLQQSYLVFGPWFWKNGFHKSAVLSGLSPIAFIDQETTPLSVALRSKDLELTRLLLLRGATPNILQFQDHPLDPETNRLLLEAGLKANSIVDGEPWALSAMWFSSALGYSAQEEILYDLLHHGLDPNAVGKDGASLVQSLFVKRYLLQGRGMGWAALASILIDQGATLDRIKIDGKPATELLTKETLTEDEETLLCFILKHSQEALGPLTLNAKQAKRLERLRSGVHRSLLDEDKTKPCPPREARPPYPTAKEPEAAARKTVVEGDVHVGTVYFIKQIHPAVSRGVNGFLAQYEPVNRRLLTGFHQLGVWRLIRDLELTTVFQEGASSNYRPENLFNDWDYRHCRELERNEISPLLLENLYGHGGKNGSYFGGCLPGFEILATQSKETAYMVNEYLSGQLAFAAPDEEDAFVFDLREKEALGYLKQYLDLNPGARVGLVFGAAHRFSEDAFRRTWNEASLPRVESFDLLTTAAQQAAFDSPGSVCHETELIQESQLISIGAIQSLRTVAGRRAALSKIDPLSVASSADGTTVLGSLGQCPCEWSSSELRELTRWLDTQKVRISEAEPKLERVRDVARMSAGEVAVALEQETHVPTQREMVKRARAIGAGAMPFLSDPEDQLAALDKLTGTCPELLGVPGVMEESGAFVSLRFTNEFERRVQEKQRPFDKCRPEAANQTP